MKKFLILVIAFVALAVTTQAQDKNKTFGLSDSYVDFTFGASDTVSNFDTLYTIAVNPSKMIDLDYDIMTSLTHVSGTPDMTVILKAKDFTEDAFDTLETFYHLNAVDTVIRWTEASSAVRARIWEIDIEENGTAKTIVEDNKWKFWE